MAKKRASSVRPRQTAVRTTLPPVAASSAQPAQPAQPAPPAPVLKAVQAALSERPIQVARPVRPAPLDNDSVDSHLSPPPERELPAWMQRGAEQILAVSYWFEPPAQRTTPYPVTVRFVGRRLDVEGPTQPGDHFVQDERIESVVPGSGPVSITARVHGVNPGAWVVTTQVRGSESAPRTRAERDNMPPLIEPAHAHYAFPLDLWRRWTPATGSSLDTAEPAHTCLLPFAPAPGLIPGAWAVMVAIGMLVALVTQSLVMAHDYLRGGPALTISLVAIAVGIIGAKAWYYALYRSFVGWCIQGFVVASIAACAILLLALHISIGVFLDATAPGLLFGMAIGRVGCFFAGCCGGPPTASRWGVWSSDQRVGARRIPTQLLELALAFSLGLATLLAVLGHGPMGGGFFVAGLAVHTLVRQGILHLRAEPRKTRRGGVITALVAALALLADIVLLVALT